MAFTGRSFNYRYLGERSLFRFYYDIDLKWVIDDTPWFFNRHLFIFHHLEAGEDPSQFPIFFSKFWVQVHNLPMGLMSEGIARWFENDIGQFIEYDMILVTKDFKSSIRIRVKLDVRHQEEANSIGS